MAENQSYPQVVLDITNQTLVAAGRRSQLTPKAFAVLQHLLAHSSQLVTKDALLDAVWPTVYVGDGVLKVAVRELRKALHDNPREPLFIETVHRRGYRFIGQLPTINTTDVQALPEANSPAKLPLHTEIIGRETEFKLLDHYWQQALQRQRQLVFINGDAGMGKSVLLSTWLKNTANSSDFLYAKGTCLEHYAAAEAYLPILDALGGLTRGSESAHLKALLTRYAPACLWQLPWLIEEADRETLRLQLIGSTPQRMLREMAEFLEVLSTEKPLILVLEDLQWSDHASLDLLSLLARRETPTQLLIMATVRTGDMHERDHPLPRLQRALSMQSNCTSINLAALARSVLVNYLAQRCPGVESELADVLHQRSAGHPLFLINAVDMLIADDVLYQGRQGWQLRVTLDADDIAVPHQLQQIMQRQMDRLSDAERRVLDAASVVQSLFAAAAIAAMLDWDVAAIEDICEDLLWRGHWLDDADSREWPDGSLSALYGFRHALYRDYVYQQLPAARRRRFHLRLAQRLEKAYQGQLNRIAADLAYHFEQGGDKRNALHYLSLAAEVDKARFAPREALRHIERALALLQGSSTNAEERAELLLQYCELLLASGQLQEAIATYRQLAAFDMTQTQSTQATPSHAIPKQKIKALLGLASALFWFDRAQCLVVAEQAESDLEQIDDPVLKAHVEGCCAHWRSLIQGYDDAQIPAYENAVTIAQQADHKAWHCQHLALLAYLRNLRGNYQGAVKVAGEGLALALQLGDGQHYLTCQFFRSWALFYAGRWGEMLDVMEDGYTIASNNGHTPWIVHFRLQQAWLALNVFDFAGARVICEPILSQVRSSGLLGSEFFLGSIILTRALLGQQQLTAAGECLDTVEQHLQQAPASIDWVLRLPWQYALAEYHLARQAWSAAQTAAQTLLQLASGPGEHTYAGLALLQDAEAALAQGEDKYALQVLQQAEVRVVQAPVAAWQVHAKLAHCYHLQGQTQLAKAHRQSSMETLEQLSASMAEHIEQRTQFMAAVVNI